MAPHFGVDVVNPDEPYSAGDFVRLGDATIESNPRVIVVGGTSLYLRSLQRGLVKTPEVDPALRMTLSDDPNIYQRLVELDPVLAERLHPNDRNRIVRGLEVVIGSGQRLSELQERHASQPNRYEIEGLWLDREDLYERIDRRVLAMMDAGYVEEVEGLLAAGYARTLKPMLSLGYRHICAHVLDGQLMDETIRLTQRDTRHFARKQRNWRKTLGYFSVEGDALSHARRVAERLFGVKATGVS